MGAGVEAQVLSATPAEVEGGICGDGYKSNILSAVAAPSDSAFPLSDWPRSRTSRGCRSSLIGRQEVPSGLTSRGQLVVSPASASFFFLQYATFNDAHQTDD